MVVGATYILEEADGLNAYTRALHHWFRLGGYRLASPRHSSSFNNLLFYDPEGKYIADFDDSVEGLRFDGFQRQTMMSAILYPRAKVFNFQNIDETCLMFGISDGTKENTLVYVIDPEGKYRDTVEYPEEALRFHEAFSYLAPKGGEDRLRAVFTGAYESVRKRMYDLESCLGFKHDILSIGHDRCLYDGGYCEEFFTGFHRMMLRFRLQPKKQAGEYIVTEGKPCFDLLPGGKRVFRRGERLFFDVINRGALSYGVVLAVSNRVIADEENKPAALTVKNMRAESCFEGREMYFGKKPFSHSVQLGYEPFFGTASFCGENTEVPIFPGIFPGRFEGLRYFLKGRPSKAEKDSRLRISFDLEGDMHGEVMVYAAPSVNAVNGRCIARLYIK